MEKNNKKILEKFLQESNLEIKPKIIVQDQDTLGCIKTKVVNLIIQCLSLEYDVLDKE